jgi:hypothetical protein
VYETDSFGKWSISTTSTRVDKEEEQPKEPKELKNACAGHWTETMTSTLQGHQNGIPTRYGTPPAGQTAAAMAPTPKPWYDEIFTHPPPSPNARYPPGLMVTPASFFGNHPSTVPPLASPVSPRTVLPALLPDPSARDTQFRDRLNSMFGVGGADCLSPISPISSRPSSRTSSRTHSRTTSRVQEYDEDDPVWKTIGLAALNVPGTLARRRRHHRRGTRVMWADQVEKKEREKETAKEKEKEKGDGIEEKMPLQCAAA